MLWKNEVFLVNLLYYVFKTFSCRSFIKMCMNFIQCCFRGQLLYVQIYNLRLSLNDLVSLLLYGSHEEFASVGTW